MPISKDLPGPHANELARSLQAELNLANRECDKLRKERDFAVNSRDGAVEVEREAKLRYRDGVRKRAAEHTEDIAKLWARIERAEGALADVTT